MQEGDGSDKVRERCVQILADAHVTLNCPAATRVLDEIISDPVSHSHEALVAATFYRNALTYGPTDPHDPSKDLIRQRAIEFIRGLLDSVVQRYEELISTHPRRFSEWPNEAREEASTLVQIAAGIGSQMYFGSGAFKEADAAAAGPSLATRARFFRETHDILAKLADVGEPSLAHQLLETVEFLIAADPAGAFLLVARIVEGGRKGGYQYDSLAVDLLVHLVERYLADYRPLLRENEDCRRGLVKTLDVFVDAGWPSARALAYRLDEMYRN